MVSKRIVILGGGPAGYAAASAAAALGASAAIVERERPGGSCTIWDAIPSKTLLDAADAMAGIDHARHVGVDLEVPERKLAFSRTLERVRRVVDHQCAGVARRLQADGVRVIEGVGEIADGDTLTVRYGAGETSIGFDVLVLATGARPWVPDFATPHLDGPGARVLTTRTIWALEDIPERLLVVGSGSTGCEMADFFQRAGSQVTLVSSRDRILPTEDPDVAWVVEAAFLRQGMRIVHESRAAGVSVDDAGVTVHLQDGRDLEGSHVLFAVGMQCNCDGLGLERVGVQLRENGKGIAIDEYCRTSVPSIYAAGDVTGGVMLANVAAMQGRHAVLHAMDKGVSPIRYEAVASTVFTDPEISDVGLTELRATEQQLEVLTVSQPLLNNPRAVIHGTTEGLVKLVVDPEAGTVLGGSIVGHRSSEIITTVALAVRAGMHVGELADTGAVNPSVSESLQRAAERATAMLQTRGQRVSSVTFS